MNSVTSLLSGQTSIAALARQIAAAIDTNHDGQISTSEFESFLDKILGGVTAATQGAVADASKVATASGNPPIAFNSEISPAVWTGDNAPYGVTFAGFSPQDHTALLLTDLKSSQNAKYAAYDYLLSNHITPDGNWAQAAADALNQQTGSTLFTAVDGETLGYGDEFIHSAPNGYGMAANTYNRSATGEFFWGSSNG